MDFTREPIIETIISPRDGFKLSVRCSRQPEQESHYVNAVEVVSFGTAFFFRSLEKPSAFLFPVSDYEVIEVREARMVFKNVSSDKPIKIGEGKDSKKSPPKPGPAKPTEKSGSTEKKPDETDNESVDGDTKKTGRKKNSRRRRSRKTDNTVEENKAAAGTQGMAAEGSAPVEDASQEEVVLPVTPRAFPTPPKFIVRAPPVESEEVSLEKSASPVEVELVETPEEVQELPTDTVEEINEDKEAS